MIAPGEIRGEDDGGFWVYVPCKNHKEAVRRCKARVLVEFDDARAVTAAQRRKAHVLLRAISEYTGYTPMEIVKWETKTLFLSDSAALHAWFSLRNCSMTEARLYITWLVDFCLAVGIPCGEPLWAIAEDIPRYVWACLMSKSCAVCGKPAQLHHVNAIGMGRNRREVPQLGMNALPLCGKHHAEAHNGERDFMVRYHLEPVPIDEQIAEVYRLTKANKKPAAAYDRRRVWEGGRLWQNANI